MSRPVRVGMLVLPSDQFWVQVREAIFQSSQPLPISLAPIEDPRLMTAPLDEQYEMIDEFAALELDTVICSHLTERLVGRFLDHRMSVVSLCELDLQHPRFTGPSGLYGVAQTIGSYVVSQLGGRGRVLLVGGVRPGSGERGNGAESRVAGLYDLFACYPGIELRHIPAGWLEHEVRPVLRSALSGAQQPPDAVIGMSDPVALGARNELRALGLLGAHTIVAGINGDPLAIAEIIGGRMAATVETPAWALGGRAVELALAAARGEELPAVYPFHQRLVTRDNVAEVAAEKLIAIAELPSRLVGVNRRQEQTRINQLETSLEINRRVGTMIDRGQLAQTIVELIRDRFGFEQVRLLHWDQQAQLTLELPAESTPSRYPPGACAVYDYVLERGQIAYVPDVRLSPRFAPDPDTPATRARVVVPIRLGGTTIGLLDLHSRHMLQYTRIDLDGLQLLADQLGIALRNAELYGEARRAQAQAERADDLKTRLLANVSHELRAPLHIILGYSQLALQTPNPYAAELPANLLQDLGHIYSSGDHLIRLINDLLDLSRAEIEELDLDLAVLDARPLLEEVFTAAAGAGQRSTVRWRLELPERLPLIQADVLRLKQILLNLLDNAANHTADGEIVLGARVAPPQLQIWVRDSGPGVPPDLREQIWQPFVTGATTHGRRGIGLGLAIARRLALLHGGSLELDGSAEQGSTFRLCLPLPSAGGAHATAPADARHELWLLGSAAEPDVVAACERGGLPLRRIHTAAELRRAVVEQLPSALACDLQASGAAGWELVRLARELPATGRLPLVLYGSELAPDAGSTALELKGAAPKRLVDLIGASVGGGQTGSVLIVDDDAGAREYYRQVVGRALPGHRVDSVCDGAAAIEWLSGTAPDLVILDLVMPEADGFAVLEHLRAVPATRHVPVIVLSGQSLSADDVQRLGHATFHSKAILDTAELEASVQRVLSGEGALAPQTSLLVKRAVAYIQQHYARDLSRQELADVAGVSESYLGQIFQRELGLSPWTFLLRYRVRHARELLDSTGASIAEVAAQVGFNDSAYFSRVFSKLVGCSPRAYRDGDGGAPLV